MYIHISKFHQESSHINQNMFSVVNHHCQWAFSATIHNPMDGLIPFTQNQSHQEKNRPNSYYSMGLLVHTSSTAQGGGGSFKNRKPIGEIGCCESRMAERIHWWTERWLELCFLEWLQWLQWSPRRSPHPQLLDVVWCSAAVVVV